MRFFTLAFCFISLQLSAQEYKLFSGNVPNKNAVELKWYSKEMKLDDSYDLYRSEAGGGFQKLNATPLKHAEVLSKEQIKAEIGKGSKNTPLLMYSRILNNGEKEEYDPETNFGLLILLTISDNELAKLAGIYFEDNTVAAGKNYEYRITKAGGKSENSLATTGITAGTYSQNAAPLGFALQAKDKSVDIKWLHDKKFAQYHIYRAASANGAFQDTITALLSDQQMKDAATGKFFFADDDSLLENGKTYYYKITGLDFFGHESKNSTEVSATPVDMTAPNPVFGLKSELKGKTVQLKWKISKEADCVGYNLYKSQKKTEGFVKLNATQIAKKDSVFTDSDVKESEQYFYYLESVDKNGNGAKTPVVSYVIPDMTPPAIPKNLSAKTDTGKITLHWDKNTETDLAGYYVFRALKNEESNFQLLNNEPLTTNSFLDTLRKEAGNYFLYRICAADKNYNRSEPCKYIAAKMPDVVPPQPVILISADWKDSKLNLKWSQNHERDLKGYEVWRADADTANNAVNPQKISTSLLSGKTVSYVDEKTPGGKNMLYYILCVDSAGNRSVASNKKMVSTAGMQASNNAATNFRGVYDAGSKTVKLTWNSAAAVNSEGFKVYRKTGSGNFLPVSNIGKATNFNDTKIENGKTYVYKILSVSMSSDDVYSTEVKVEIK